MLPDYDYRFETGLDYGVLTVPFKLQHVAGSIAAGATIGGYVGYRKRDVTFLGSIGLSTIPIQNVNATAVVTKEGITYAGGVVFKVAKGFRLGAIVGRDHIGDKTYAYEDKTWFSLAIGIAFTQ